MSNLILNHSEVVKWFRDNGDYTHNITYDLTEDSVIMDLGGYTGVWVDQMIQKYNPNVYVLEPIKPFYDGMVKRFSGNNKVRLMCAGVSIEDREGVIFLNGDGSSSNLIEGESINVKFKTMDTILNEFGLSEVDLLQINIEGDEYPLLEHMLSTGLINKFKNIQVQFHLGIEDDIERRNKIREGLLNNGFNIKFDYPFVWESWTKND